MACFFNPPWHRVSPALTKSAQSWLLAVAAFNLRSLGRLTEALEPMRVSMEMEIARSNWKKSASSTFNLSELALMLGDVPAAVRYAEQSMTLADRSGDVFQRMVNRVRQAYTLHQAGRRAEALGYFRGAEEMQDKDQPRSSLQSFLFCDLLLAEAEQAASRKGGAGADGAALAEAIREVEERSVSTLEVARQDHGPLDIALCHLTLGRAALYRSILEGSALAPARAEIEQAADGLHGAGVRDYFALGLLTRAWLLSVEGNFTAAHADLDEAQEIAERGPMPLYLADIALYRGRLFGDREALAEARRLIVKHGYGRRLEELADAEEALASRGAG